MLRIHFIQHWFNLADLACEEALYDSASLRRFVGIAWDVNPRPTRPRCSGSVGCSMQTSWAKPC